MDPGTIGAYRALSADALEALHTIAQQVAGEPIRVRVNSGQRLPDHNAAVGGAPESFHLPPRFRGSRSANPGVAADVYVETFMGRRLTGPQHATIAEALRGKMRRNEVRPGGVSAYHTAWNPGSEGKRPFIHVDSRGTLADWE